MATIQAGGGQNNLPQPESAKYSRFDQLSKHIYTTGRFGENQVCGVMNAIQGDKIKFRNEHKLTTYTLSAPLMTNIYMEKDLFQVPRQAILPFNWEKIHQQPNIGEDIDATVVGTSIQPEIWQRFLNQINTQTNNAWNATLNQQTVEQELEQITNLLKNVIVAEYIYSYGSLLNNLGCKMAAIWRPTQGGETEIWKEFARVKNFDELFEKIIYEIEYGFSVYWEDNEEEFYIVQGIRADKQIDQNVAGNKISMHEFLTKARDDSNWHITTWYKSSTEIQDNVTNLISQTGRMRAAAKTTMNNRTEYEEPVDLARVWAYQLINAEYFSNDKVDYIYSAELYRQYIGNLIDQQEGDFYTFTWNGISYQYDYLSAYYFGLMTNQLNYNYLAALFCYRRSLKYLDYFTGSKTHPLGVGDFNINPDEQGRISVIDITKKVQAQRFANAVNRIGRKAEDYAKALFGVNMARDWHNPIWLGSTRDLIRASETENTGEAQINEPNAVTARLESYGGSKEFEFSVDRDSIIICLYFFDLERAYARSVHRSFMHVNRYDMYNPYLQYTGDQEIKSAEYDASLEATGEQNYFGYVPAYEEFKQDFNEAQGGFITALPGYTFIDGMEKSQGTFRPTQIKQGPDFIRQKPVELDRYYNSLTGNSLANYFHFIIDFYNEIDARRPMSYNPQIM